MADLPDWIHGAEHMYERHGVTPDQANEALLDPFRVTLKPDPASRSQISERVIGWCESRDELLTVILVREEEHLWGANGWPSNRTDQHRYEGVRP